MFSKVIRDLKCVKILLDPNLINIHDEHSTRFWFKHANMPVDKKKRKKHLQENKTSFFPSGDKKGDKKLSLSSTLLSVYTQ